MSDLAFSHIGDRSAREPGCSPQASARPLADGPGLSKGHNVTNPFAKPAQDRPPYRFECWEGAGLLRIVSPYFGQPLPREECKRGTVKGYSDKARNRARKFLATITDEALEKALMVTLTYPGDDCPEAIPSAEEWTLYKGHLRKFGQNAKRRFGVSAVWVLEFQRRGAPHYHLLVFGIEEDRLLEFRAWVAAEWNRLVGGDSKHLQAGTQCDPTKSPNGARSYLTKYMTKGDQSLEGVEVGRYWGKVNSRAIPQAVETVEELTPEQARIAARVARKWVAKRRWEAAWHRFQNQAAKRFPTFRAMGREEFRKMCLCFQKGGEVYSYKLPNGEGWTSSIFLLYALTGGTRGRFPWPQRPKTRSNCTVNVYCRASAFREALVRHPRWHETRTPLVIRPSRRIDLQPY